MKKFILIIGLCLLWASISFPATYYVTQSGGGDGSACGANALSISQFNASATAGNTYVVCTGQTITTTILPVNSGSSGSPIVLQSQTQYGATISTASYGANLSSKSYITIDGFYFNDCGNRWIIMVNSDYCIIQNNKFYDSASYTGFRLEDGSNYNKILDNVFEDSPSVGTATYPSDYIGFYGTDSNYNIIEGNTFGNVTHDIIWLDNATYTVIRGNIFQNEYHTGINLNDDGPNLIENNYFYDQGKDMVNDPEPNVYMRNNPAIQLNGTYQIIRRNIFDNNGSGMLISTYDAALTEAYYNRIYHNTVNRGVIPLFGEAVDAYYLIGNVFKNNIFTNSEQSSYGPDTRPDPYEINYRDNNGADNRFYNNNAWGTNGDYRYRSTIEATFAAIISAFSTEFPSGNVSSDPQYVNATLRDFRILSSSPMRNAGTWLTQANGDAPGGSSTSLTVDDASYFYDGWGISGETPDTIRIINTDDDPAAVTVQISSISGNVITLSSAQDWDDNAYIYHCPDGICFNGSAPDIGAFEYVGIVPPPNDFGRTVWR